ncbi:MAG: sulfate ABC transporter substrate-binding protein, partial [Microcystaceae cyanobacterium]
MFDKRLRFLGLMLIGVVMSWAIASCSSATTDTSTTATTAANTTSNQPVKLTLVSYAVTQSAYEKIIPKFTQQWKDKAGQDVTFDQSYGGSGSQTRAVIDGLEADVVALALAGDTKKIEKAGLIQAGWEKELPNDAIVTKSVAALVKRDDKIQLTKWSDLTNSEIKVITANPKTSGGAKWNFLALWGSVTQAGGSPQAAQTFVEKVYKNVPVLPKDAREASDVFFKQGQGNVLINYENEVILAKQKGG